MQSISSNTNAIFSLYLQTSTLLLVVKHVHQGYYVWMRQCFEGLDLLVLLDFVQRLVLMFHDFEGDFFTCLFLYCHEDLAVSALAFLDLDFVVLHFYYSEKKPERLLLFERVY